LFQVFVLCHDQVALEKNKKKRTEAQPTFVLRSFIYIFVLYY
jgi:hypothetical protein